MSFVSEKSNFREKNNCQKGESHTKLVVTIIEECVAWHIPFHIPLLPSFQYYNFSPIPGKEINYNRFFGSSVEFYKCNEGNKRMCHKGMCT